MATPVTRSSWWGEYLHLAQPPTGVTVLPDETCVRVRTRLPGRGRALATIGLTGLLAVTVLISTVLAHPQTAALHALWWVMVVVSVLIIAVATPLLVVVARAHRLLVLNPGVLLLSEYHGWRDSGITCLLPDLRSIALNIEDGTGVSSLVIEIEMSPTQQRIQQLATDPEDTILAVAHCCHDQRREVVRYLGRLIADWAQMQLYEPGDRASSSRLQIPRR